MPVPDRMQPSAVRLASGTFFPGLPHPGQNRAGSHGLAFRHAHPEQDSGFGTRQVRVDFVGRDGQQAFIALDGVAFGLEPGGHRPFGDALAKLGHCEGNGH